MREHELKTWPIPFQAILDGNKRHEIRVDDRGFAPGDVLWLREWNDGKCEMNLFAASGYTGREIRVRVTYLTPGGAWGLPENLCVMSISHDADAGVGGEKPLTEQDVRDALAKGAEERKAAERTLKRSPRR